MVEVSHIGTPRLATIRNEVQLVSVLFSSLESEGRVYRLSVAVASLMLADTEFLLRVRHND